MRKARQAAWKLHRPNGASDNGGSPRAPREKLPLVSVVLAVRNEEPHIKRCLGQLVAQNYPHDRLEIIVADGMSTDRTREIVENFKGNGIPVRLLLNPGLGRAQGLNVAIRAAKGDVIVRIDARTVVAPDYVSRCVRTLLTTGADNVGGVQRAVARNVTQEAIGLALAHPFGVGDAAFRLGKKSGFVDTVYLGCFRREVFDKVGLFDEDAPVISEDSDINYRIRKAGGTVYLDKDIVAYYFPRETVCDLWNQYFRYGGARAGNLLKHKRLTSWRQTVAPLFLFSLVLFLILAFVDLRFLSIFWSILGLYLLADLSVSLTLTLQQRSLALFPRLVLVFPCMHLAWALGFWKRLLLPVQPGTYWKY